MSVLFSETVLGGQIRAIESMWPVEFLIHEIFGEDFASKTCC